MKRLFTICALFAALAVGTPALRADHDDKDKDHKHQHGNKHVDRDDDDRNWERREGYEYRTYGDRDDDRPPGWSRGKKTGWKDCGLPPGQAKKYGCRTYIYQGRPHYYYRDERGRIVVRRPILDVHGGVTVH